MILKNFTNNCLACLIKYLEGGKNRLDVFNRLEFKADKRKSEALGRYYN